MKKIAFLLIDVPNIKLTSLLLTYVCEHKNIKRVTFLSPIIYCWHDIFAIAQCKAFSYRLPVDQFYSNI